MDRSSTLQLKPIEEGDLEEAIQIEIDANPDEDAQRILVGRARTPSAIAKLVELRRKALLSDLNTTFLKVVDPASRDQIIAWAIWHFCPEKMEEEVARGPEISKWPLPLWYRPFLEFRHETLRGRPHYVVGLLVTDPNHQRRGAASWLVQWGVTKADEAGLNTWVASSVAGKPLYEKFGFRALKTIDFDMAQLGYKGVDRHTCMLREPQPHA